MSRWSELGWFDELRLARTGGAGARSARRVPASAAAASVPEVPEVPGITLGPLAPGAYDRLREALPALQLSFDEPAVHGAVLRQLGAPASWRRSGSPAELLAPLVRAAAERARRIAMAELEVATAAGIATEPASPPPASAALRRAKRPRSAMPRTPAAVKMMRRRAPGCGKAPRPRRARATQDG